VRVYTPLEIFCNDLTRCFSAVAELRLQSRGLESLTAGLQSLRLASRLQTRGLGLLIAYGGWWRLATAYGYTNKKINCCKLAHSVFTSILLCPMHDQKIVMPLFVNQQLISLTIRVYW